MIYDAHNQASYKLYMRKIIENKKDLDNGGMNEWMIDLYSAPTALVWTASYLQS